MAVGQFRQDLLLFERLEVALKPFQRHDVGRPVAQIEASYERSPQSVRLGGVYHALVLAGEVSLDLPPDSGEECAIRAAIHLRGPFALQNAKKKQRY